jgi:hypothetical protein
LYGLLHVPDLYGSLEWLNSTSVPLIFKALSKTPSTLNIILFLLRLWDKKRG